MNKTININLGGFFFHIDEEAYRILKNYLESIARSLSDDPQGKNEIITDIEARISELLSEIIKDSRQVINESDINDVIKIMGQPEDYDDHTEEYSNTPPNHNTRTTTSKKLYRDADGKFLGGVAAGLGHYFGIDSIWVRLAFILLMITGGFGIPIYIILWILLPEATTTAEKLEMEGEAVNIDNIEKKIRTEFNNVGDKIKNADYSKAKTGFQNFLDTLGKIILAIFKTIGKFIGVLLMFVAAAVLIALIILGFSFGSLEILGMSSLYHSSSAFIFESIIPFWLIAITIFIAISIPFFLLFILGLRIVSTSVKQFSKPTSLTLLAIWILAILTLIFTGIETGTATAISTSKIQEETFQHSVQDTLTINIVNDNNILFKQTLRKNDDQQLVYDGDTQKTYSNNIYTDVIYNDTDAYTVSIRRIASGKDRGMANKYAEDIEYKYTVVDNQLNLNGFFLKPKQTPDREEKVAITISVPKNTCIYFSKSTQSFLGPMENIQDIYKHDMPNHNFIMRDVGLECTDCDERLYRN